MRTKLQQYPNVAAIIAENVVVNGGNDTVFGEAEKSMYNWIEASTATPDGMNILQETRTVGAGRWHRMITASGVFTGTTNSAVIPNGNTIRTDVTVTGALPSLFNSAKVTNEVALNLAGLDVISATVIAVDTVRVTLYNNTGDNIAAQSVEVSLLQF